MNPKVIGIQTLILTVAGYATLLTYTWPHGFLPLISIQSLPVVLIGFVTVMLVVWFVLALMFLPFGLLADDEYLSQLFYESRGEGRKIRIPIGDLYKDVVEANGRFGAVFTSILLLLQINFLLFTWYVVASSLPNPEALLPMAPVIWLAWRSLSGLLTAKSRDDVLLFGAGVAFFFLVAPTTLPVRSVASQGFQPNPLVNLALKNAALGGGLPVSIESGPHRGLETNNGILLFFDGVNAWLLPCNPGNERWTPVFGQGAARDK